MSIEDSLKNGRVKEELLSLVDFNSKDEYIKYLRGKHNYLRAIDEKYKLPKILGMTTGVSLFLLSSIAGANFLADINVDFSLTEEQQNRKYMEIGLCSLGALTGFGIGVFSYYYPPSRRNLKMIREVDNRIKDFY